MAEPTVRKFLLDTDQSEQNLVDLQKQIDGLNAKLNQSGNNTEKLADNAKSADSGFKKVGATLSNLGKATGVVALLGAAFSTIKNVIQSTQPIADAFSAGFGTFTDIIRDFVNLVIDNFGTVSTFFQDVFEKPGEYVSKLGDLIRDNIIERFNSALEVAGSLGKALLNLFTGEFQAAFDEVKNAGLEMVDVLTGVDDTVNKVSDAVVEGATAFADYVTETYKANEALVALQNNAKLAAAEQARLAEQYDRQAELLRQTRDDESKSIQDRINANTKLGEVLAKQEQAELAAAQAQVAAAQATFQHNQTIDNQVALTQALAGVDAVRAKVAGIKSEQLVNEIALNKELNAILKVQSESAADLAIAQAKFNADSIKNDLDRLNAQRAVLEQEKQIQLERLQSEIDKYAQGTQARVDAEIAFAQKKQEIDQAIASNTTAIQVAQDARELELQRLRIENGAIDSQSKIDLLNAEYKEKQLLYANDAAVLEQIELEKARKIKLIEKETQQSKLDFAKQTLDGIAAITSAFGKNNEKVAKRAFQVQKAISIAQATISTYESANSIFNSTAKNPITVAFPAAPFVASGVAVAAGLANVATIASQQFQGTGSTPGNNNTPPSFGGGGGGGADTGTQPAQFNPLASQFVTNRPDQYLPRAYVLAGDVSSQQEVRENVEDLARIG
jgi:hypothetical protein